MSAPQAGLPERISLISRAAAPFIDFRNGPLWARCQASVAPCDFMFGNPHDPPLPEMVEAIREAAVPKRPDWFAYTLSERKAQQAVSSSLRDRLGMEFAPEDVVLTKGAASAIAVVLQTVLSPDDEVLYVSPPWFFYEAMIRFAGAKPVSVRCDEDNFDLGVEAIGDALTSKTRAVIVNSPHNPTGRVYPDSTLARLAATLSVASERQGRPIYLLSDEAYQRILFPGTTFTSPTAHYPHSFLIYTYGKTLLNPGQRLGYAALSPAMPPGQAAELRSALLLVQLAGGAWFPDAVMQYALPRLETLCIDLAQLCRRRDLLVATLREQGYEVHVPEGTFYLLPRAPIPDDQAFAALLADEDVYVLPGHVVEMPGYFRLSLTASDEMVDRSLKGFALARQRALDARETSS